MVFTFPCLSTSGWLLKYEHKGSHISNVRFNDRVRESYLVSQCFRIDLYSVLQKSEKSLRDSILFTEW